MTQGDIINLFGANVAAAAEANFQPAAQSEWIVFTIGAELSLQASPNVVPNVTVRLTDGTNLSYVLTSSGASMWGGFKVGLTNNAYLRIKNEADVTADISISGVQTK